MELSTVHGQHLSLMMMGVDLFKSINDNHGLEFILQQDRKGLQERLLAGPGLHHTCGGHPMRFTIEVADRRSIQQGRPC